MQADTIATQARTIEAQKKQIEVLTQEKFAVSSAVQSLQSTLSPDAVAYEAVRLCLLEDKDVIEEKAKNIVVVGMEEHDSDSKAS